MASGCPRTGVAESGGAGMSNHLAATDPSLQPLWAACFGEGCDARIAGKTMEANPYQNISRHA
jgi:hypothetical protein